MYLGYKNKHHGIWVCSKMGYPGPPLFFSSLFLIGGHGLIANGFSFNWLEPLRPGSSRKTKTYENRNRLHLGQDRPKMLKTCWKDVKQSLYEMAMVTCPCPRQKWETICVSAPSLEERPCLGAARPVNWSQWDDVSWASDKHLSTNRLFSIECNDRISESNLCWGCNPITLPYKRIRIEALWESPPWSCAEWARRRGGSYPLFAAWLGHAKGPSMPKVDEDFLGKWQVNVATKIWDDTNYKFW